MAQMPVQKCNCGNNGNDVPSSPATKITLTNQLLSIPSSLGTLTAQLSALFECQLLSIPSSLGTLTAQLSALFECPVCLEIVLPPIMQCDVGHIVCSNCRLKLSRCPVCRGTLGNIRNLAMEKVASNLMFPCKHKQAGCSSVLLGLNKKVEHEEVCKFRPCCCPCPGILCFWRGHFGKVMNHLQQAHKDIATVNDENTIFLVTDIDAPGTVYWVLLQSCFGHHFMLVLKKQDKLHGYTQFFANMQLIGSHKQAERFTYRFDMNGNRRRLTWEAMPRSCQEGVASAIMSSDCLVFDTSIAQHFTDNDGNLSINVTIWLTR